MFEDVASQLEESTRRLGDLDDLDLRDLARVRRIIDQIEAIYAQHAADRDHNLLAVAAGTSTRAARTAAQLGHALSTSNSFAAAVATGRAGLESAHILAPFAVHPDFEQHGKPLLEAAADRLSPGKLRTLAEQWKAERDAGDHHSTEESRRGTRSLTFGPDPRHPGMTLIHGRLDNLDARHVKLALDALVNQQRLDDSGRTRQQRYADALTALCTAFNTGDITGGREAAQLIVTIDLDALAAQHGFATESFGDTITSEQARRVACDCQIHPVLRRNTGAILNFGRRTRAVSNNLFNSLALRDKGCAFHGCDRPTPWCQAHHITFWRHGGTTEPDNLVLLCSEHHHLVHDDHWTISGSPGHWKFEPPQPRHRETIADRQYAAAAR